MRKKKQCKSIVLVNELAERIIDGTLPPGSDFLSMEELMHKYDISIVTANKILRELNAQRLIEVHRGRKSKILFQGTAPPKLPRPIGIVNAANEPYRLTKWRNELLLEVQQLILAHGNQSLWLPADFSFRNVCDKCVGLIYSSELIPDGQWEMLMHSGIPCARISFERPFFNSVFIDYRFALDQVVVHLITAACKKIFFLFSNSFECSEAKLWFQRHARLMELLDAYKVTGEERCFLIATPESWDKLNDEIAGSRDKFAIISLCSNCHDVLARIMERNQRRRHSDYEIYTTIPVEEKHLAGHCIDMKYPLVAQEVVDLFYKQCVAGSPQAGRIVLADFVPVAVNEHDSENIL